MVAFSLFSRQIPHKQGPVGFVDTNIGKMLPSKIPMNMTPSTEKERLRAATHSQPPLVQLPRANSLLMWEPFDHPVEQRPRQGAKNSLSDAHRDR